MKRDLLILSFFAVTLMAMCVLSFSGMSRWRVHRANQDRDQLVWLRSEFNLSEAELSRIRELHEAYLPQCEAMCVRIATKRNELSMELERGSEVTQTMVAKIQEAADLHAECQVQMLRHFFSVSQAMPPEQGKRYLEVMKQFALIGPGGPGLNSMPDHRPAKHHGQN